MGKRFSLILLVLFVSLGLYACGAGEQTPDESPPDESDLQSHDTVEEEGNEEKTVENQTPGMKESEDREPVTLSFINADEEEVGTANLEEREEGVKIQLDVSELIEGQEHGFHIHETGICFPPDFKSAGGHFNPDDSDHGFDAENGPHAGDLPNITADENGAVSEEITAENVTLATGEDNSLLDEDGSSLIIHEDADDYESQPSGDAGDRLACGVIEQPND